MKKLLLPILLILLIFLLSACEQNANISNDSEIQYIEMNAMYRPYFSAQELVEEADAVFIGKVTKISFQVLDLRTGLPPMEKTMYDYGRLFTIYDVDIELSYKGDAITKQIIQYGGIKDLYKEEQVTVLKDADVWRGGIPVDRAMRETIELGQTYLFTVRLYNANETVYSILKYPEQSYYSMHNPFVEHYQNLTAKKIIATFGQDKWDTYWNQWKTDNPDWESWIDQATLEKEQVE